jgi:hypothetical protein
LGFAANTSGWKNPKTMKKQITRLLQFKAGLKNTSEKRSGARFHRVFNFSLSILVFREENAGKLTPIRDKK